MFELILYWVDADRVEHAKLMGAYPHLLLCQVAARDELARYHQRNLYGPALFEPWRVRTECRAAKGTSP